MVCLLAFTCVRNNFKKRYYYSLLKHTYVGDVNYATIDEVISIVEGNISGRINR